MSNDKPRTISEKDGIKVDMHIASGGKTLPETRPAESAPKKDRTPQP